MIEQERDKRCIVVEVLTSFNQA